MCFDKQEEDQKRVTDPPFTIHNCFEIWLSIKLQCVLQISNESNPKEMALFDNYSKSFLVIFSVVVIITFKCWAAKHKSKLFSFFMQALKLW